MAGCSSAGDTGTAASVSPSWERASWWEESADTLVRTSGHSIRQKASLRRGLFSFLYLTHRCSYVLGSGSLWHLPHLWIKGYILYSLEGSTAGKHHLISLLLHLARTLCHQSSALSTVRVDFPAASLHDQCRFSVDMTRRSHVWLSALSWTWLSRGQR